MMRSRRNIFKDDQGFTTTSVVLALLITLALVFSSAQVYRINSASAQVQDVADACALAAENQIAKYMLIARACDAVILSLSLTSSVTLGVGVVALCIPSAQPLSARLIDAGKSMLDARDRFAESAASGLQKAQEYLPFMAAAAAEAVANANSEQGTSSYWAVALLIPSDGESVIASVDERAETAKKAIDQNADGVSRQAAEADAAASDAAEAKLRGFQRDCGDNPGYCMYERAQTLADLPAGENPLYESQDAWSFSVALERAKAYYRYRLQREAPANGSIAEQARSALRANFYRYACAQMDQAYVREGDDSFEANFPLLPSNTQEMMETSLAQEAVYPVTVDAEGTVTWHAFAGCPNAAGSVGVSSINKIPEDYQPCSLCNFTAASMGDVAAASTSIENGFEYHYRAVAQAAQDYQKARQRLDPLSNQVKGTVRGLLDQLKALVADAGSMRLEPQPPGRYGALAFVANVRQQPANAGFETAFVNAQGSLGPTAAVAAATLLDEHSQDGATAISSLLDGVKQNGSALTGAGGIALDVWSHALSAYADGQNALLDGLEEGLNKVPLRTASGLGTWCADALRQTVRSAGLQPAEVEALKPVLVNSGHVASKSDSEAGQAYMTVKRQVYAHPLMSTDLFSSVLTDAERQAIERIDAIGDSIPIASVELEGFEGGIISVPITIPFPQEVGDGAKGLVSSALEELRSLYYEAREGRIWE